MSCRTLRPGRSVTLLVTALAVLAALLVAPSSTAAAPQDDDPRAEQAKAALARVQELLDGKPGKATEALSRHEAPDVTMALRDLFLHKDALTGADRGDADRILARPSTEAGPDGEPKYDGEEVHTSCSTAVCVHYVTTKSGTEDHRVTGPDGNENGHPDFVDHVRNAATYSDRQMRKFGYRGPRPDGLKGSAATSDADRDLPDIYLADVGGTIGAFGYAVPEGKKAGWGWGAWGYLVLDNNFEEFCGSNLCSDAQALKLMRVTAAHEYFHVVQFGYDYGEDAWFMEATATWIEDEIFDGINDNVNFLRASPNALKTPWFPIDHKDANWYGNWIWFRYLSERFGRKVVLKAWRKADGFTGGGRTPPDKYSIKAVFKGVKAVTGKGKKFWNKEFAKFGDTNRRPHRFYSEARGQKYPRAPKAGAFTLWKGKKKKARNFDLSRLATATYRIKPHKSLWQGWKVRIRVKGNPAWRGGHAVATVKWKSGGFKRVNFSLGGNGRKTKTLPFGKANVRWIEVTVANASVRNHCWIAGEWKNDFDSQWARNTCKGRSKDNNREQSIVAKAIRR